jgi:hypothetical protein
VQRPTPIRPDMNWVKVQNLYGASREITCVSKVNDLIFSVMFCNGYSSAHINGDFVIRNNEKCQCTRFSQTSFHKYMTANSPILVGYCAINPRFELSDSREFNKCHSLDVARFS